MANKNHVISNIIRKQITPELVIGLMGMREISKEEFKMIMEFEKKQKKAIQLKG